MTKRELEKRVEELEKRVNELEATPLKWPVPWDVQPYVVPDWTYRPYRPHPMYYDKITCGLPGGTTV